VVAGIIDASDALDHERAQRGARVGLGGRQAGCAWLRSSDLPGAHGLDAARRLAADDPMPGSAVAHKADQSPQRAKAPAVGSAESETGSIAPGTRVVRPPRRSRTQAASPPLSTLAEAVRYDMGAAPPALMRSAASESPQ